MALRDAMRIWRGAGMLDPGPWPSPSPRPQLSSPWAVGDLSSIVWADVLGLEVLPPSRAEAMQVAALARAVNLFKTTIARCPLTVLTGAEPVAPLPTWCQRTDGLTSPFHRMLWTVDDLIFHGESLWIRLNGADGFPLSADRLPYEDWSVDSAGAILIGAEPVDTSKVIYLPGPHEGILKYGARAIRQASALETSALDTAQHPFRVHLHQVTDEEPSDQEKRDLIAAARQAMYENSGVLYTNQAVTVELLTFDSSALLIEGRNAASVDMARIVSSPAALVDATSAGASLTYETVAGRNGELIDYGLSGYMAAVAARLSMDDVVPRGQRVAFDTSQLSTLTPSPTGPATED